MKITVLLFFEANTENLVIQLRLAVASRTIGPKSAMNTSMMNPGSATRQLAGWGSVGFNLTCHALSFVVTRSVANGS